MLWLRLKRFNKNSSNGIYCKCKAVQMRGWGRRYLERIIPPQGVPGPKKFGNHCSMVCVIYRSTLVTYKLCHHVIVIDSSTDCQRMSWSVRLSWCSVQTVTTSWRCGVSSGAFHPAPASKQWVWSWIWWREDPSSPYSSALFPLLILNHPKLCPILSLLILHYPSPSVKGNCTPKLLFTC